MAGRTSPLAVLACGLAAAAVLVGAAAAAAGSGPMSTIAGTGAFSSTGDGGPATAATLAPDGVAIDPATGDIVVAERDFHVVRRISAATGLIRTIVGRPGPPGSTGDGGPAVDALVNAPRGVSIDPTPGPTRGDILVAEHLGHRVRRISAATGIITTVAGTGTAGSSGEGLVATSAELNHPGVAIVDPATGDVYISEVVGPETSLVAGRVRRVSGGIITTVAGGGLNTSENIPATDFDLIQPVGLAIEPTTGDLIIGTGNLHRVFRVSRATGIISRVAGTGTAGFNGDGIDATAARLNNPIGVAVEAATGDVLIAESGGHRVRRVSAATGLISTVAGTGTAGFSEPPGPATSAQLNSPMNVAVDPSGAVVVSDLQNRRLRRAEFAADVVAEWLFDEPSGTLALDSGPSGGHPGTLVDASFGRGLAGNAVTLMGGSARVEVPDAAPLQLTGEVTVEVLFRPTAAPIADVPLAIKNGSYGLFLLPSRRPELRMSIGGVHEVVTAPAALALHRWHHVAGTYAPGGSPALRLYVNGVLVASGEASGQVDVTANPVVMGHGLVGSLDRVAIHASSFRDGEARAQADAQLNVRAFVGGSAAAVLAVDVPARTVAATIPAVANLSGAAVHPDGTRAYLASQSPDAVVEVDTATERVTAVIPTGGSAPWGLAIAPDGASVYVTHLGSGDVSTISTATRQVLARAPVGSAPRGVAAHPDGTRLYVTNYSDGTVSVIDTGAFAVTATVTVGSLPAGVAVHPAGTAVYVANFGSGTISVIDPATNTVSAAISGLGGSPQGVAVSPDGRQLYATNPSSSRVWVIRTDTRVIVSTLTGLPFDGDGGIAVTPDGAEALVTSASDDALVVLDTDPESFTNAFDGTIDVGAGTFTFGTFIGPTSAPAAAPGDVADLQVTVSAPPFLRGADQLTYTIAVRNLDGAATATGVAAMAPLPVGTTFVSADFATCTCPAVGSGGTALFLIGDMGPGAVVTIRMTVRVATTGTVTNRVGLSFTSVDPDLANNSAGASTDVGGGIRGRITSGGVAVAGARVDLAPNGAGTFASVTADANGVYVARALEPGDYRVQAIAEGFGARYYQSALVHHLANLVQVTAALTEGIDIALTAGAGGIGGQVRDSGGSGVAGALVGINLGAGGGVLTIVTDGSGNYATGHVLPPGTYRVSAVTEGFATRWYSGAATFTTATDVGVSAGATTGGIDIVLTAGAVGGFTGTVTVDGVQAPGILVEIFDATTGEFLRSTITDGAGAYDTGRVLPAGGSYKLRARGPGVIQRFHDDKASLATADVVTVPADGDTTIDFALGSGFGISGTVTSLGAALTGAVVEVITAANVFLGESAVTDASGGYSFDGRLAAGGYKLRVRHPGLATTYYSARGSLTAADVVTIVDADVTGVNVDLAPGGGITGRVADTADSALAGVTIDVFDAGNAFVDGPFVTGTDGRYTVERRLAPGTYKLRARRAGYGDTFHAGAPNLALATLVTVSAGADTEIGDIVLARGGRVRGTVTRGGSPVAGALVDLFDDASNTSVRTVTADASGQYDFGVTVRPGDYNVRARVAATTGFNGFERWHPSALDAFAAEMVSVAEDGDRSLIDVDMLVGGTIQGTIGNAGSGVTVLVFRVNGSTFGTTSVTTNASGQYTFRGLHDGEWILRAERTGAEVGYYSGAAAVPAMAATPAGDSGTAIPIVVAGGVTSTTVHGVTATGPGGHDLTLRSGGATIQGRIMRADTGAPVAGAFVRAIAGEGVGFPRSSFVTQAIQATDAGGNYSIARLPAGAYVVELLATSTTGNGWYPTGTPNPGAALPVAVGAGATVTGIDFAVPGFGGAVTARSIAGTVVDIDTVPVPFGSISAVDPLSNFPVRGVALRGDGTYVIDNLPPGRYVVRTSVERDLRQRVHDGQDIPVQGEHIDLTASSRSGVDLVLPGGAGTVRGRITRHDNGQPIAGAFVQLRNFADNTVVGSATSRVDGSFQFRGVPPDSYRLRASKSGFLVRHYTDSGVGGLILEEGSFVEVDGTDVAGKDIALVAGGATLTGTLLQQESAGPAVPLVPGVVSVRDARGGGTLFTGLTRTGGAWSISGLATGDYKVRFGALGTEGEWFDDRAHRDEATVVRVVGSETISLGTVVLRQHTTTISGVARDADDTLAGVFVSVFDVSAGDGADDGLASSGGVTDSAGRYTVRGLRAGRQYVVRATALGHSQPFYAGALTGVPDRASATQITLVEGADTGGIDFRMFRTATIRGVIGYAGARRAPLRVELFKDAALSQRAYVQVIEDPTGAQAYSFARPEPDTRGILPGTYFVRAFMDVVANQVLDAGEPEAVHGGGTPVGVVVAEGGDVVVDLTLTEPATGFNLPPLAQAQSLTTSRNGPVAIQLGGTDAETAAGALVFGLPGGAASAQGGTVAATGPAVTYTPAAGFVGTDSFTFTVTDDGRCSTGAVCTAPRSSAPATVTITVVAPGSTVLAPAALVIASPPVCQSPGAPPGCGVPSEPQPIGDVQIVERASGALDTAGRVTVQLPAGLTFAGLPRVSEELSNGLRHDPASPRLDDASTFSFRFASASATGPGTVLITGMRVVAAPGFVTGSHAQPVDIAVGGTNAGLAAQAVTVATAVGPNRSPEINGISPGRVARGVSGRTVALTGVNLGGPGRVTTADLGPGVIVTAVDVVGSHRVELTVDVSPAATAGPRDVTLTTDCCAGGPATVVVPGGFLVTDPPTISGTDRDGGNPLRQGLGAPQPMRIFGTGFGAPPPDVQVSFAGPGRAGITVQAIDFWSSEELRLMVTVDPDPSACPEDEPQCGADLGDRGVSLTNPDGGVATSAASAVVVAGALPTDDIGLAPRRPRTRLAPVGPTVSALSPASGAPGMAIGITGTGFDPTPSANTVTFTGLDGVRVAAVVTAATAGQLTVLVPAAAVDGPVTVGVNGLLGQGPVFTLDDPRVVAALPGVLLRGVAAQTIDLAGHRFTPDAAVSVTANGTPVDGIQVDSVVFVNSTRLVVTLSVAATAGLGPVDVSVATGAGRTATLGAALEVRPPAPATLTIGVDAAGGTGAFLPSVASVTVTRDATGRCTGKTVAAAAVPLVVTFSSTLVPPPRPPRSVTIEAAASAIPGTATNEDCQPAGAPVLDYTLGVEDGKTAKVVVVETAPGSGRYRTTLYSYDMGGTVRLEAKGTMTRADGAGQEVDGTIVLPLDRDGDGIPDAIEEDGALNADAAGVNVLDPADADRNGNGLPDGEDRFVRDGLGHRAKWRGVFLRGPVAGSAGPVTHHLRLGAGMRNLFARGRGWGNDPAVLAVPGTCGIDPATGVPVPDPTLSPVSPCPEFAVGQAFARAGVRVIDVTASFAAGTELPTVSLAEPARAILDVATVVYDGVNCYGFQDCSRTAKTAARQFEPPTFGFAAIGSATAYGQDIRVFKRSVDAVFTHRPYQHRRNDVTRVVLAPDGRPMLAPITLVGDRNDNGVVDRREPTVNGELAGDTYIVDGQHLDLSALDVNNDGCIELPLATDPTLLPRCDPAAYAAAPPQATRRQVARFFATHELGHGVGIPMHSADPPDVMFQFTTDFARDVFAPPSAALIQIHNGGRP